MTTSFGIFKYMASYSLTEFILFQRGLCSFDNIIWNVQVHDLLQSNTVCLVSERVGQFDNIVWNIKYMACYSLTQFVMFQRGSCSFDNIILNIQVHGLLQSNTVCLVSERVVQL